MVWLIVVIAVVVGMGVFLAWVGNQPPTDPQSSHWPWSPTPDVVSTDRELQRLAGRHVRDDEDKIEV